MTQSRLPARLGERREFFLHGPQSPRGSLCPAVSSAPRRAPTPTLCLLTNPWVPRGRHVHTAQRSPEGRKGRKELIGARAGRGRAGGNHLTPEPPLVFGTPGTDGGQLELAEDERPKCGNPGRGPPRASWVSWEEGTRAFFRSLPGCHHCCVGCGDRTWLPSSGADDRELFPALTTIPPRASWLASLLAWWQWQQGLWRRGT